MTGRLVLLSTSPRVAPGLLSATAWDALRSGATVLAAEGHPMTPYVEEQGVTVTTPDTDGPGATVDALLAAAAGPVGAVWLVGADGDEAIGRALGAALESGRSRVELEVLPGSYDLPGARLLDLVAVMDKLRSPGGCPWDAEQTHASLTTYLLEETYETIEAIDTGDRDLLREELGDLLLQVVFHSRIAAEDPTAPWSVDDVAEGIVSKLVRRHPHVFAAGTEDTTSGHRPATSADVESRWETAKAREKGRSSAVEGVPIALPALSLASKLLHRAERHGLGVDRVPASTGVTLGDRMMDLVVEARSRGLDPETELRRVVRDFARRVTATESGDSTL